MKRWLLLLLVVLGLTVVAGTLASSPTVPHAEHAAPSHVTAPAQVKHARPALATSKTPRHVQQAASPSPRPAREARTMHSPPAPHGGTRSAPLSAPGGVPGRAEPEAAVLARAHDSTAVALDATPMRTAPAAERYLLADPPAASPGATVSLQAGGFTPGAAVSVTLDVPGQPPLMGAVVAAGTDGAFRATSVMPLTQTSPSVEVVAQDSHGYAATATLLLHVAQPLAGVAPNVVTPGQKVAVWVANARPGETMHIYAGRLAGPPLLTAQVGSDGRGSWPLAWDPLESTCRHASLSIL